MTILVDQAIWFCRDRFWAHLASDISYAELHVFADELGLRRMAFQGDHYDVPADIRRRAIAQGALPVESRDLLGRLKTSGLRLSARSRPSSWSEWGRWGRLEAVIDIPKILLSSCLSLELGNELIEVSALCRDNEWAIVVLATVPIVVPMFSDVVEHRLSNNGYLLELVMSI